MTSMFKKDSRVYYWLVVVLWLGVIFLLSSIPGASLPRMPNENWHFWAHRLAHIGEYGVLGFLVIRAYSYKKARIGVFTILLLSVFIFLSGAFDEWHQSFVPGRTPQLLDAIFDTICGAWGMLVYYYWPKIYSKS
jgi:VanZ family protein